MKLRHGSESYISQSHNVPQVNQDIEAFHFKFAEGRNKYLLK